MCEISLPCRINRKQHGYLGVFGINTGSWHFKTPQISLAAVAASDILVIFEISLAAFIPNTPRNHAISYTKLELDEGMAPYLAMQRAKPCIKETFETQCIKTYIWKTFIFIYVPEMSKQHIHILQPHTKM